MSRVLESLGRASGKAVDPLSVGRSTSNGGITVSEIGALMVGLDDILDTLIRAKYFECSYSHKKLSRWWLEHVKRHAKISGWGAKLNASLFAEVSLEEFTSGRVWAVKQREEKLGNMDARRSRAHRYKDLLGILQTLESEAEDIIQRNYYGK